jgi:vitamin B12 transporter
MSAHRVALASLLAFPGSLLAQEQARDTARVVPVVVSATRTPLSRVALPVAVTVITGDEMRLRGITTVAEALNDVTSAYVAQAGSQGGTTSLFLRGGESKYVKVLIDGVPVNDPGGAYDFGSLTTDNLDRIEIVRGPASVIYGADAVTGVVNLITRRGTAAPVVDVEVSGGSMPRDRRVNSVFGQPSMATLDATVTAHGQAGNGAYAVAFGRHETEGLYEVNNAYFSSVASARVDLAPTPTTSIRLTARYTDYAFHYPTNGGGTVTPGDVNAFRTEDRTALGVAIERSTSERERLVLTLSSSENHGATDDQMDGAGGNSFVSLDRVRRRGIELRDHLTLGARTALTVGAQLEYQDQRSQFQSDSPFGPFNDRFSASRRNSGVYGELVAEPVPAVTATVGIRGDDNEQFGTFTTGRAGLSWRPRTGTRLRATAGTAFREPTFSENYSTGFVTGNPGLEPERTRSADAGIEQEFGARMQAGVTAFAQRFENMIDYTGSTTACGFSYCNVAAARSNGVEADLRVRVLADLTLAAGATFLQTRVVTPGFDNTSAGLYQDGEALIRRPENKWNVELAYRPAGRFSATARMLGVGRRTDRDFTAFPATPVVLPAFQRVDVSGEYRFPLKRTQRTAITFRVENLANVYYENVFNFLAPRRTVTLGARASF